MDRKLKNNVYAWRQKASFIAMLMKLREVEQ